MYTYSSMQPFRTCWEDWDRVFKSNSMRDVLVPWGSRSRATFRRFGKHGTGSYSKITMKLYNGFWGVPRYNVFYSNFPNFWKLVTCTTVYTVYIYLNLLNLYVPTNFELIWLVKFTSSFCYLFVTGSQSSTSE